MKHESSMEIKCLVARNTSCSAKVSIIRDRILTQSTEPQKSFISKELYTCINSQLFREYQLKESTAHRTARVRDLPLNKFNSPNKTIWEFESMFILSCLVVAWSEKWTLEKWRIFVVVFLSLSAAKYDHTLNFVQWLIKVWVVGASQTRAVWCRSWLLIIGKQIHTTMLVEFHSKGITVPPFSKCLIWYPTSGLSQRYFFRGINWIFQVGNTNSWCSRVAHTDKINAVIFPRRIHSHNSGVNKENIKIF